MEQTKPTFEDVFEYIQGCDSLALSKHEKAYRSFVRSASVEQLNETKDGYTLVGAGLCNDSAVHIAMDFWVECRPNLFGNFVGSRYSICDRGLIPTQKDWDLAQKLKAERKASGTDKPGDTKHWVIERAFEDAQKIAKMTEEELLQEAVRRAAPLSSVFSKEVQSWSSGSAQEKRISVLPRGLMAISAFFGRAALLGCKPPQEAIDATLGKLQDMRDVMRKRGVPVMMAIEPPEADMSGGEMAAHA